VKQNLEHFFLYNFDSLEEISATLFENCVVLKQLGSNLRKLYFNS